MDDDRPRDAHGRSLSDDEIRTLVRKGLADGTLLRQEPVIAGRGETLLGEGSFPDPCAICGGTPSRDRYYPDRPGPGLAFHQRCRRIWLEEIEKWR